MGMTKKDFIGIAQKLAAIRPIHPDHDSINHMDIAQVNYQRGAYSYWKQSCEAVASHCLKTNMSFDLNKFFEACND